VFDALFIRYYTQYPALTVEEEIQCKQTRIFKWGDTMVAGDIAREQHRFMAAPGSSLSNARLATGAASSNPLHARARELMLINSAMQGKDAHANVSNVPAAVAAAAAAAPVPRRTSAAATMPVKSVVAVQQPSDAYGVDCIQDVKVVNSKLQFFVKWTGYEVSQNTWEPEDYIMNPILITNFKLNFAAAYNAAIADVSKKILEKERRKQQPHEAQAAEQVFSSHGRAINAPKR
jgi:hypothetical protein